MSTLGTETDVTLVSHITHNISFNKWCKLTSKVAVELPVSDILTFLVSKFLILIFSWSSWAVHIQLSGGQMLFVCLDVKQGATSHNCCTRRLVILHTQTYWWTLNSHQKLGHPDLLCWVFRLLNKKICVLIYTRSPNLHCRCIWFECTNRFARSFTFFSLLWVSKCKHQIFGQLSWHKS